MLVLHIPSPISVCISDQPPSGGDKAECLTLGSFRNNIRKFSCPKSLDPLLSFKDNDQVFKHGDVASAKLQTVLHIVVISCALPHSPISHQLTLFRVCGQ